MPEAQVQARPRLRSQPIEIGLAVLIAFLSFLSPLTSGNRVLVSAALGLFFGAAFYAYRRFANGALDANASLGASHVMRQIDRRFWVAAALSLLLFAPTLVDLFPWFTESVWRNGHGLFLPLLIFAVARDRIRTLGDVAANGSAWGIAFLVPGLALIALDSGVQSLYLAVAGMPLVVVGLVLTFLGPRWARALSVPIGLLLFLLPIPSGVSGPLGMDVATAVCTQWMLEILAHPVAREGVLLKIDAESHYAISLRCAGFSIFYGAVALAIAAGTVAGSWRRTLALIAVAFPLSLLANGLRVAALVILCEWIGVPPSGTILHGMSGIAAYLLAMLAILLLAGRTARQRLLAQ